MKSPEMYRVVWLDSGIHKDLGWASAADYMEGTGLAEMTVTTVGMIMHEDDDIVTLGLNYDPNHDNWIGVQLIARQNIISVERLTPHIGGQIATT